MPDIVVNACFGSFGLSKQAEELLTDRKGEPVDYFFGSIDQNRADPDLVAVVRELGDAANGSYARLRITTVPDDVEWFIDEYDGREHVAEKHRTW